jgi:hypothetical protein
MVAQKLIWKSMSSAICFFQSEIIKSIITSVLPIGWRRLSIDYYTTDCERAFYWIRPS